MDKVKLPKEIVDAIEHLRDTGKAEFYYDFIHYDGGPDFDDPAWNKIANYRNNNFNKFVEALVIGWEVEETPEERAIQWLMNQEMISRDDAKKYVTGIIRAYKGANEHE